jgi:AraC-like DNA-binding protein
MQSIPLVRKVSLAPAVTYLASEGVPVDRYLQRARLSAPTPETSELLIPLHQLCDFLNTVARGEGLDDLGFRIAGSLGIESLGSFGRLIAQAFTFHESIQISRDFISTYNSGQQIWIERHGDQVQYCQKLVGCLPQGRTTEVVHLGLANALAAAGLARGTDWRPSRIELPTDPIDLGAYVPELADIPISFNQPHTSLWFEQRWLSEPLPAFDSSNGSLAEANERASSVATSPAADPIGQLQQVIESSLGHPEVSVEFIASTIGTSARTLQRRLAEHDTSFSRLLQAVRFRNSQRLLRDPGMPLTEIAKRLGYTDLANFMRAFKRWAGVGPSEFRRLHCGTGRE